MKIQLAEHFGLCFGVRDAIAQAEQLASAAPLTILGELVHNPVVRGRLRELGAGESQLEGPPIAPAPTVMITAHGASDAAQNRWRSAGYQIADGTCPLVRHAHEQLKKLVSSGCFPVVIGQRGHVEVRGLVGDFPGAAVVESTAECAGIATHARYGVIAQTTQPIDHVRTIVSALQAAHPESEVRFVDTVCKPTKNRQSALRKLVATCDTIVIVGGRSSNNTRQLVLAAASAGRRAFHVERPEELNPADFVETRIVGLTAGTSTLGETVTAVRERLEEIALTQLVKRTAPAALHPPV